METTKLIMLKHYNEFHLGADVRMKTIKMYKSTVHHLLGELRFGLANFQVDTYSQWCMRKKQPTPYK